MTQFSGLGMDLLGVFAVGIGAAALLFALTHAARKAGRPLPGWLLPAGIGVAILTYATWNEYSWAGRVKAQLPERVQVVAEGTGRSGLRPWTYVVAPVSRLALPISSAILLTSRVSPVRKPLTSINGRPSVVSVEVSMKSGTGVRVATNSRYRFMVNKPLSFFRRPGSRERTSNPAPDRFPRRRFRPTGA